jgi:LETM1 and EF-hand domain-containing protein 1
MLIAVGKISVHDLEQALSVIKHAPSPEVVHGVVQKLDVDGDGFVVLEHVLDLIGEEGLGKFASSSYSPLASLLSRYCRG